AMVMADQGTCCIDEFDKMGNEQQVGGVWVACCDEFALSVLTPHAPSLGSVEAMEQKPALLEAMEQQSVSVAKAGLLANFSARTAVLAAANPVGGHYNRARTLNENLKLSAALLSRFDLIFILLDRPDHHTDQRLSEHVLQMHAGMPSRSKASKRSSHLFLTAPSATDGHASHLDLPLSHPHLFLTAPSATDGHASHLDLPLSHRLRLRSSAARNFSPLSPARLRQYIAYARTHVHPRLSEEARAVIKAFYLRLREHRRAMDGPAVPQCIIISLAKPTAIPCVSAARFDYRLSEEARAVIKAFYLRLREHRRAMDGPAVPQCIIISLAKPTAMPCVSAARFDYRLSEEARAVIKAFYLRLREHSRAMDGPPVPQCIIIYLAKPTAIPCVSAARFHYRLSEEARAVIKAFYLRLREHSRAMDGPPITARQLESLVRLAEARARVELREEVTEADAQEAVELMGECLLDKLTDEAGNIDAGRGGSSSKSKESKRFLAALQRTAKQAIKTCFSRKELAQSEDGMCLRVPDLNVLMPCHVLSFHTPIPIFHTPIPIFHTPIPIFHTPIPIFHTPIPIFHTPIPIFHTPIPIFHTPIPIFHTPIPIFHTPIAIFHISIAQLPHPHCPTSTSPLPIFHISIAQLQHPHCPSSTSPLPNFHIPIAQLPHPHCPSSTSPLPNFNIPIAHLPHPDRLSGAGPISGRHVSESAGSSCAD
ncbi:unnamed protein product, partial [Closterium sp. NIES-64]